VLAIGASWDCNAADSIVDRYAHLVKLVKPCLAIAGISEPPAIIQCWQP
jgi:hypothetical protein